MLHRAPSVESLTEYWQNEICKIETCIDCRKCMSCCPYSLNTLELLIRNYEDYQCF